MEREAGGLWGGAATEAEGKAEDRDVWEVERRTRSLGDGGVGCAHSTERLSQVKMGDQASDSARRRPGATFFFFLIYRKDRKILMTERGQGHSPWH